MLNDTLAAGLNNPDCAFYVGMFAGMGLLFQYLLLALFFFVVYRFAEELAIKPFINRLKKKWWKQEK